jgi:hypothetical protein
MHDHALTIRAARPRDADDLLRLAQLDSRGSLRGYTLIAERGGVAIAALALSSGAVAADPFSATADAVRALRLRRYQLMRHGGHPGPVSSMLRRLARRPAVAI